MNEQKDAIAILLANRCYLYKLFQRVFGNEPDLELMKIVTNEHTLESCDLLFQDKDGGKFGHHDVLEKLKSKVENEPENITEALKSEYTYYFIGPHKLPAPPWESVYRNKERKLFQESTLEVRHAYLEYEFLPANYPHEADDHLALELDFMYHLAELAQREFEQGNTETVKKVLTDQQNFLQKHMLQWVDEFAKLMQNGNRTEFYPHMSALLSKMIHLDAEVIEEIISSI